MKNHKQWRITLVAVIVFMLGATSCKNETGTIQIQSKVHNVTLTQVSWGNTKVVSSLRPGETSDKLEIEDKRDTWPKTYQVEFNMTSNGNVVYLKTKAKYTLDYDQDLLIVISDTTSVYNPMFE
jgi:hypothetical protein